MKSTLGELVHFLGASTDEGFRERVGEAALVFAVALDPRAITQHAGSELDSLPPLTEEVRLDGRGDSHLDETWSDRPTSLAVVDKATGEASVVVSLEGNAIFVGRSGDTNIRLAVPTVSASHALLVREKGAWMVRDLDSTNGTWVQGAALGREPFPLPDGVWVSFGPQVHARFLTRERLRRLVAEMRPRA